MASERLPYPEAQQVNLAVDNCIFTVSRGQLQVLLIQIKKAPLTGKWALPGGLIRDDERLNEAAERILREQTGVERVYLEQLYAFDEMRRDPGARVVSVAYVSLIHPDGARLRTTEKYEAIRFWDYASLPPEGLAYDHRQVVTYARKRLAWKVQYSNVIWSLLPSRFTLSQLQSAYEVVLDRELDKRNFRKKILSLGLLDASGERSRGGRHRPAMLYRFKSEEPQIIEVL